MDTRTTSRESEEPSNAEALERAAAQIDEAFRIRSTSLDLDNNRLTALPETIGQLTQLESLNLSGNRLTALPETIAQLTQLESLYLSGNRLTALPETIAQLTELERLDLSDNQLTALPQTIGQLRQLKDLNLSDNQLTALPETIGQLTQLESLNLSGNRLTALPETIAQLTQLESLFLHRNQALGLPAEVLGAGWLETLNDNKQASKPADIFEYYFRVRSSQRPLLEAKLVLVGIGGVGKTSIVNRLVYGQFDIAEGKTKGISITDWSIVLPNREHAKLHIWDFGGQEIMHATHQFFLTQRSLYLLVIAGRQGREDADAEYWLNLLTSFAADSPVIIILNKIREHAFDINRSALRQKFPNIRAVIKTDCEDRTGFDDLAELIQRETDGLPHLRDQFPATWFAIKERLSLMKENYLTFEGYRALCSELGESDSTAQERLAGFLHSLGIALNYKDDPRLRDTHVLNPRWVTEGVYKILNHEKLEGQRGELCSVDLLEILDQQEYPPERHGFIIQLMHKFELCFPFMDEDDRYLVPELLGKEQPLGIDEWDLTACLNFEYRYPTLLPEGLLPRFIVRTYVMSAEEPRWRSGVVLRLEQNRALVLADSIERRVRISIAGPPAGRRRLLAVIRADFERIHSNYKFKPQELVPVPAHPDIQVLYSELQVFEKAGIPAFPKVVGDQVLQLDVRELLDGVDLDGMRQESTATHRSNKMQRAFISYSHKDETLRAELETHLKLLNREGLLALWSDRRITAGDEWKGKIDEELERADLILLLVSADFIASDYCYDIEVNRALERHEAGSTRVVPLIVRDCDWKPAPFGKLQALPRNGKAIAAGSRSKYQRDTMWKEVAERLREVLLSLNGTPPRLRPVSTSPR